MEQLTYTDGVYRTATRPISWWRRTFPSLIFYSRFLTIIWQASQLSRRGDYDNASWCRSSMGILRALERVGIRFEISGIDHLRGVDGPCVIVSNHMSMLETVILPIIVQPEKDVTFVVKQSLLEYPVFKHVMRSRDPVAVTRANPREDFKAVMEGGRARLDRGISIVVFPQTTRTTQFDPEQFNSIGAKLAHRAKVPIVPLALKTDAWNNGSRLKDFGKVDTQQPVRFAFGPPVPAGGRGSNAHDQVVAFVRDQLAEWA